MNWIKKKFIDVSIIFISIFIALAVFEFFLIFDNKSKPVQRTLVNINDNDYNFIKDSSIPNVFIKKNKKKKIFIIGDSFVEGIVCAADKENFPCHLDRMLSQNNNVLNLGVGGANPVNYIDFLENLKISNEDDVLIVLHDNDIHLSPGNCKHINRQSKDFGSFLPKMCENPDGNIIDKSKQSVIKKINHSIRRFKIVKLLKETAFQIPMFSNKFYRSEFRNRWNDFEAEENKWILSSLKLMKKIVEEKGGNIYFIYYPNTNKISKDDERHIKWLKFIEYTNKNHNISILDPYPYFILNAKNQSMVWSLTDKHPNCEAHKLMAEFINQEIGKKLISD